MDSVDTYWADRVALEWQVELGVTDAICDAPVNRYEVPEKVAKPLAAVTDPKVAPIAVSPTEVDSVARATQMADAATDIAGLQAALQAFDLCEHKRGARNLVFAHGDSSARVMVIGEAPDRDTDRAGTPFAKGAATLLDRMLDAIGLGIAADDDAHKIYTAAPMPWRGPTDTADAKDMAMMAPFLMRHIALANPDVVILMGNTACQMLLGKSGISRLRGNWTEVLGRPTLPMLHPSALIQNPLAKRDAWSDLRALRTKLDN